VFFIVHQPGAEVARRQTKVAAPCRNERAQVTRAMISELGKKIITILIALSAACAAIMTGRRHQFACFDT